MERPNNTILINSRGSGVDDNDVPYFMKLYYPQKKYVVVETLEEAVSFLNGVSNFMDRSLFEIAEVKDAFEYICEPIEYK